MIRFPKVWIGTCGWVWRILGLVLRGHTIPKCGVPGLIFGVGEMGDMEYHHFDTTFDARKLSAPLRVRQTTPSSTGPLWGKQWIVEVIFAGTPMTAGDTVKLTWNDGDLRPDENRILLPKGIERVPLSGTFWIGEHGYIYKTDGSARPFVLPEENFPTEKYPRLQPRNHYHDWVGAILEGCKSCADFSHGAPLTEAVLVGAVADRVAGQWLEWDAKALKFKNSAEATKLVHRVYRDGWKVPGLG